MKTITLKTFALNLAVALIFGLDGSAALASTIDASSSVAPVAFLSSSGDAAIASEAFQEEFNWPTANKGTNLIPLPAAVWMFGAALGALGALRRRASRRS